MILNNEWKSFLNDELHKDYYIKLQIFIDNEYKTKIIFPKYNEIFRAFNLLSPKKVKVIIVGQDPYHGQNQANGLAFSVCDKCKIPHHYLIFLKSYMKILAVIFRHAGILLNGLMKVYYL